MTVTVPLVLLFGLGVAALLKFRAVGVGAAALVLLFGFYLADSAAADTVRQLVTAVGDVLGDIRK